MTKIIALTQGMVAIVDDEDFEWLSQWKWYAARYGEKFYASRKIGKWPSQKTMLMHRAILNPPEGMQIDHINGDGLRNTRDNLRVCTNTENQRNKGKRKGNVSGYKGVRPLRNGNKYEAYIFNNGKQIYLGKFTDIEDAARAYDSAAKKYHGDFANLNFEHE